MRVFFFGLSPQCTNLMKPYTKVVQLVLPAFDFIRFCIYQILCMSDFNLDLSIFIIIIYIVIISCSPLV